MLDCLRKENELARFIAVMILVIELSYSLDTLDVQFVIKYICDNYQLLLFDFFKENHISQVKLRVMFCLGSGILSKFYGVKFFRLIDLLGICHDALRALVFHIPNVFIYNDSLNYQVYELFLTTDLFIYASLIHSLLIIQKCVNLAVC